MSDMGDEQRTGGDAEAMEAGLNEASAALVALSSEDGAGISRLQDRLERLARESANGQRATLEGAASALSAALLLPAQRRGAALGEAGRLIESALRGSAPQGAGARAEGALPADLDAGLVESFVSESREYLRAAEAALLALEKNPSDAESVNTVFRAVHTMKGVAGFLDLGLITDVAHHAESLLSRVRDNELAFSGEVAELCLRTVDALGALLDGLQAALAGAPFVAPPGHRELVAELSACAAASTPPVPAEGAPRLGDILVSEGKAERSLVEAAAASAGGERIGAALVRAGAASDRDVEEALKRQRALAEAGHAAEAFVRVRTDRFDRLVDAIGELVIAQSMIAQDTSLRAEGRTALTRKVSHAGKIVRDLQDLGMSMRMVPMKATFQKMARLARDVAKRGGKEVELKTSGEDVEIDRGMVDVVDELLVHMVRNAVDHGLENPQERRLAGKSPQGTLSLSSSHAGGSVCFTIADDGRGLDRERILRKALSRGLVREGSVLSDREVHDLIFLPGFSTADKVTDISGRGVGMDVVKTGVESLRGRIDLDSEPGKGCRFTLRLPLTLAVTDGLLVRVGEERFLLPTNAILRMLRPKAADLHRVGQGAEMAVVQGESLPIVRLHGLLGCPGAVEDPAQAVLVVIEDAGRRCALLVDEPLGQQQVVAKPLGEAFGRLPGVSGGAILGDGRVGLILDPQGLAALSRRTT